MKKLTRFAMRTLAVLYLSLYIIAGIARAQTLPVGPPTDNLDSWSFNNTNNWTSDLGYAPTSFTNILGDLYGNGTSLMVDSNSPAWLRFAGFNTDGTTNLTVGPTGSIFFWFSPDWASATTNNNGAGPGVFGRLLEVGAYSTNATYGWFSLFVDPGATNLYFCTQTNSGEGAVYTNLSVPIDWATNAWQFVALTYSGTNLSLYTNGAMATNAPGLTKYPGLDVLTNGFWIGSGSNGILQMHGWMDDLYTYSYPLDSITISNIYSYFYGVYLILPFGNVMPDALIQPGPSSPGYVTGSWDAITGLGFMQWVTNTPTCVTNSNVWITNVSCMLVGTGSNQTVNFTFSIQGGIDGAAYDVFAVSPLGPTAATGSTNGTTWSWVGQGYHCNTYTATNLPVSTACLILGTPQDSDMDGLTDAFEKLVSHTNPYNADGDSDGTPDGIKWLEGRNMFVPGTVPDTNGTVHLDVFTPLN